MGGDHIKALIRWRFDWVGGSVIRFGHRYLTLREARGSSNRWSKSGRRWRIGIFGVEVEVFRLWELNEETDGSGDGNKECEKQG